MNKNLFLFILSLIAAVLTIILAPYSRMGGYLVPLVIIYAMLVDRESSRRPVALAIVTVLYDLVFSPFPFGVASVGLFLIFIFCYTVQNHTAIDLDSWPIIGVVYVVFFLLFVFVTSTPFGYRPQLLDGVGLTVFALCMCAVCSLLYRTYPFRFNGRQR